MRTSTRRFGALVIVSLAPMAAFGQAQPAGQSPQAGPDQTPNPPVVQQDVLTIQAGAETETHSNIFKLPSGTDPQPLYGKSNRGDTIVRGFVGITFDRDVSLQHFRFDARIEPNKFVSYSKFDYLAYQGGFNWDWAIGRPFFGTLGVRTGQTLSSFLNNFTGGEKNLEKRLNYYATGGIHLTPRWSFVVGADVVERDSSVQRFQYTDFTYTSGEAGLRYEPGTGTELEFVARHTIGDYPTQQNFDALGNVLAQPIDNSFKQNAGLVRLQIKPSNDSRIAGQVGYTKRSYDKLDQRDFSGVTMGLNLDWAPTGAFLMKLEAIRDLQTEDILTSNYVDVATLRATPTIILTGKITLNGIATYSERSYKGDPGFVQTTGPVRKDKYTVFGAQVAYEFSRNLLFTLEGRTEHRSSNYDGFQFTDNILMLGARARF